MERAVSSKNKNFVGNRASAVEASPPSTELGSRLGMGVLGNRSNRLADLATGAVVDHPQELVDPARCRIWELHNRDYAALTHERRADLIESVIDKGRQEMTAIVRRDGKDPAHDFEDNPGARRD